MSSRAYGNALTFASFAGRGRSKAAGLALAPAWFARGIGRALAGLLLAGLFCRGTAQADVWYVSPAGSDAAAGTSWAAAKRTVQAGVDAAAAGDTVWVGDGVYLLDAPVRILRAITLASASGAQAAVLDGQTRGRCLMVGDEEHEVAAAVDGFTVRNGFANMGGGVFCHGGTIRNCLITGNVAHGDNDFNNDGIGGGVYIAFGTLTNCLVSANRAQATNDYATGKGGGVYAWNASVERCAVSNNVAAGFYTWGGGVAMVGTILRQSRIADNTGEAFYTASGGGVYADWGALIDGCVVFNNRTRALESWIYTAASAEGGGLRTGNGTVVRNTLVCGNTAAASAGFTIGGGVWTSGSTLENCTVTANRATTQNGHPGDSGGVSWGYSDTCRNNIIWGNFADANPDNGDVNVYSFPMFVHSDVGPGAPAENLQNSFAADPLFVNAAAGDFRLLPGSPCIDTGLNREWMTGAADLGGNPRVSPASGTVDMGAFEYWVEPPPALAVTPAALDFGSVLVGSAAERTFTVQNSGGGVLTGVVSGVAAPFEVVGSGSYLLAGGAAAAVTIRFTPAAAGAFSNRLDFAGAGGAARAVTGRGVTEPPCRLTVQATVPGVAIASTTGHGGTTPYTVTVAQGDPVHLAAPASHGAGAALRTFTGWVVPGLVQPAVFPGPSEVTFAMEGDTTCTAQYAAASADDGDYLCDPAGDAGLATVGAFDGYLYVADAFGGGEATAVRGTFSLKITGLAGKLTAKAVLQGGSVSFKGTSWSAPETDGTRRAELTAAGGERLTLFVRQNRIWGTLTGGKAGAAGLSLDGSRNRFAERGDTGAAALLEAFKGYYTVALPAAEDGAVSASAGVDAVPQGIGYLAITVGAKGSAKVAGVLADGTKLTQSSRLILFDGCGPEACVPLFVPLYAKRGWAGGLLWVTPNRGTVVTDRDIGWFIRWENPGRSGPDGFSLLLNACGGFYGTGASLSSAYLFGAGMDGTAYYDALGEPREWAAWPEAVPVTAAGGHMAVAKGAKPKKVSEGGEVGYEYDAVNPANVTLSFASRTGLFKGKFSLCCDFEDASGNVVHKAVSVPYAGVLTPVRDSGFAALPIGMGSCLVPDNAPSLKAYKIKRSCPVWLETAP